LLLGLRNRLSDILCVLHHTTRPSLWTSRWDDLDAAVRAVAGERGTGRLAVVGNRSSGSIFFEDGHVVFALSDSEDVTSLIDPGWFDSIGSAPLTLEASLASSVPPGEVAARIGEIIDRVIHLLRGNETATIEFGSEMSPVRSRVTFDAAEWFDLNASTAFGLYRLTRIA
jgi:hypothetical protein